MANNSLGEIPGGNLRGYYRLEDVNDTGPNGYTLTNNNSVTFGVGKFANAADFGSSGTNKGLRLEGSNITSTGNPSNLLVSFWFKLNSTSNTSRNHFFFVVHGSPGSTTSLNFYCYYTISGGTLSVLVNVDRTTGTFSATKTLTADTNWHHCLCRFISNPLVSINIDRTAAVQSATLTGSASSPSTLNTISLAIGNARGLTLQAFAMIDEFFVSESLGVTESGDDPGHRLKYYTHASGFMV